MRRVDKDGKKVLFVEEIQSDLAQAIRTTNENIKDIKKKLETEVDKTEIRKLKRELVEFEGRQITLPDIPLTKTWHENVLKQIIKEATEKGMDRVSWTTGQQQVDRYKGMANPGGMIKNYDEIYVSAANKVLKPTQSKVISSEINVANNENEDPAYQRVHTVELTPEVKHLVQTVGFSFFQDKTNDEPRGRVSFGSDKTIIDLFKGKDKSTFLHESGHIYLEMFKNIAERTNVVPEIKADFQTILDWLDVKPGEEITTEQHEKFARGIEQYFRDGNAPSEKLEKAFYRFKQWLLRIYEYAKNLNVEINPEIRDVFDRIFASDEEIKRQAPRPILIGSPGIELSFEDAKKYQEAIEAGHIASQTMLEQILMEDVRKKTKREYNDAKRSLTKGFEANANEMPVFKLKSILQDGRMVNGDPLPEVFADLKISKSSLVEEFGPDILKTLPSYMIANDGVYHPQVAELFGFENSTDMITHLATSMSKKEFVDRSVDDVLRQMFPDNLTTNIEQSAIDSLHNERQGAVLAFELQWMLDHNLDVFKGLIRASTKRPWANAIVKAQAERIINNELISNIKPRKYLTAENRAARESGEALARGDFQKMFEAKQRQLLNMHLYRAALDAKATEIKTVKSWNKSFSRSDENLSKSRDVDLVNVGRQILNNLGLLNKAPTSDTYLKDLEKYDIDKYNSLMSNYKDLIELKLAYNAFTHGDFLDLKEQVDAIWKLSKSDMQMVIDGKVISLNQARDLISQRLDEINDNKALEAGLTRDVTPWDKFTDAFMGVMAHFTRMESWINAFDKDSSGPGRTYMLKAVQDGVLYYKENHQRVSKEFSKIIEDNAEIFKRQQLDLRKYGIPYSSISKGNLLMALLHSGNESNLRKLLIGRPGWGEVNEDGSLNSDRWQAALNKMFSDGTLNKQDLDFAQSIWDLMESLKPEAQKAHKSQYGYYFNEITAKPLITPWGAL